MIYWHVYINSFIYVYVHSPMSIHSFIIIHNNNNNNNNNNAPHQVHHALRAEIGDADVAGQPLLAHALHAWGFGWLVGWLVYAWHAFFDAYELTGVGWFMHEF